MASTVVVLALVVTCTGLQADPVAYEGEASVVWQDVLRVIEKFTPLFEEVSSDACRVHGRAFLEGVRELQPWAMKMLDASSKFPSGALGGNIKELGQYDECVDSRGQLSEEMAAASPGIEPIFSGQYCLANVHLSSDHKLSPQHLQVEQLLDTMTYGKRSQEITINKSSENFYLAFPSLSLVQWSVCVPSSCSPRDVQLTLDRGLSDLARHVGLRASTQLFPEFCSSTPRSEPPDWSTGEMAMIAVLGMLVTVVAFASAYHLLRQPSPQDSVVQKILLAFSFPSNWSRLFTMEEIQGNSIPTMDGLRSITILCIIALHVTMFFSSGPITNKIMVIKKLKSVENMPFVTNSIAVDTFLLLSGALRCHNVLGDLSNRKFKPFLSVFYRYCRSTPVLAMMIALHATLAHRISHGPEMAKYLGLGVTACQQSNVWVYMLLYVNNYGNEKDGCLLESWSLAILMQLFVLSPLLIYPLWHWPRFGIKLLIATIIVSCAIPVIEIYRRSLLPLGIISGHESEHIEYAMRFYAWTHTRFSPYVVGLGLGYLLYQPTYYRLSTRRVALGWALSLLLQAGVVFGPYHIVQMEYQYNRLEAALYGGLHRTVWAFALAWVIFSCHRGHGGWVSRCLSAGIFRPVSRLGYCIYLTQISVMKYNAGIEKNAYYVDNMYTVRTILGNACIILAVSTVMYLLVEAPTGQLITILKYGGKPRQTTSTQTNFEKLKGK